MFSQLAEQGSPQGVIVAFGSVGHCLGGQSPDKTQSPFSFLKYPYLQMQDPLQVRERSGFAFCILSSIVSTFGILLIFETLRL
jgi:hypothetical protein